MPEKKQLLIVEDQTMFRQILKNWLEKEYQVHEADGDPQKLFALLAQGGFNYILMDVVLPGVNTGKILNKITADYPDAIVLMLSAHSQPFRVQEMIQAGARGYLLKEDGIENLSLALKVAQTGGYYFSPGLKEEIQGIFKKGGRAKKELLTDREKELLVYISEGLNVKAAAFTMEVSRKTADTHLDNLYKKLGIASRTHAELIVIAKEQGWI